jgi:hypothetical protein
MTDQTSKLDELRRKMGELEKAKREADRLRQEAIAELLQQRKDITRQLRQLGYESEPSEEPRQAPGTAGAAAEPDRALLLFGELPSINSRRKRLVKKDTQSRRCPVCEVDGHDLRAHRGQTLKRPFSTEEMRERGLLA